MSREEQRLAEYDVIGKTYNVTRQADKRITQTLINSLDTPTTSLILDIGAGTGNYSVELAKHGYKVIAVEPSKIMRETGKKHPNIIWSEGTAENLPLEDNSVDGIISTLTIHHFSDLNQAFREMLRVSKVNAKIVIFAADPRLCPDNSCWLKDYFNPIISQSYQVYRPIEEVVSKLSQVTNSRVEVKEFPIPYDINDCFFASAWRRPEMYLEKDFRAGVSPLAKCPDDVLGPLLNRLESDLKSGKWDETYGYLLSQNTYEGGYRFLITTKS